MRESYFASDIEAVHQALAEGERKTSANVNELLNAIQQSLAALLADDESPEREWRKRAATSLDALSRTMRTIGKPTPSVERLISERDI